MIQIRRCLLAVLLLVCSLSASAEVVPLRFKDVKVASLIDVVMREIVKRPFVVSSEVVHSDQSITLSVEPDRSRVLDVLRNAVSVAGVLMGERDGVLYFEKASGAVATPFAELRPENSVSVPAISPVVPSEVDRQFVAYHPKYRPVEMLVNIAKAAGVSIPDVKGRLDAVVFSGSVEQVERVRKLLAEVDKPLRSVFVKAALVEYIDSSEKQRGVTALLSVLKGRFGIQYQAGNSLVNSITLNAPNLQAVLSALDGDSRFSTMSEPSMRVLDGEVGRLVVGSDVPARGATVVSNGQTTQGVDYKTVGVVLQVEPRIQEQSVVMKISQSVSDVQLTTSSGIDSPTLTKREASTTVDLADGEIMLIAGMDATKKASTRSGLFFLPSVLQSSSETSTNSQIMLLLEVKRNSGLSL